MSNVEPFSYDQAKSDPRWVAAIDKELEALEQIGTWDIVHLPSDINPDGTVEKCKGILVSRGDRQVKGEDYKHMFSPAAKFTTVRTVLAIVVACHI